MAVHDRQMSYAGGRRYRRTECRWFLSFASTKRRVNSNSECPTRRTQVVTRYSRVRKTTVVLTDEVLDHEETEALPVSSRLPAVVVVKEVYQPLRETPCAEPLFLTRELIVRRSRMLAPCMTSWLRAGINHNRIRYFEHNVLVHHLHVKRDRFVGTLVRGILQQLVQDELKGSPIECGDIPHNFIRQAHINHGTSSERQTDLASELLHLFDKRRSVYWCF